jgi:predicted nucleotidyltransferase
MTHQKAPQVERAAGFLEHLRAWVEPREDVRALMVVGSVARGDARPDSDVDVVLLTNDPARYLENTEWVSDFGAAQGVELERYGRVTSVRAGFDNGLEVEFAIAAADWASTPLDPGTEAVARDGIVVLLDRDGDATALAGACGPSNQPLERTDAWASKDLRCERSAPSAQRQGR